MLLLALLLVRLDGLVAQLLMTEGKQFSVALQAIAIIEACSYS